MSALVNEVVIPFGLRKLGFVEIGMWLLRSEDLRNPESFARCKGDDMLEVVDSRFWPWQGRRGGEISREIAHFDRKTVLPVGPMFRTGPRIRKSVYSPHLVLTLGERRYVLRGNQLEAVIARDPGTHFGITQEPADRLARVQIEDYVGTIYGILGRVAEIGYANRRGILEPEHLLVCDVDYLLNGSGGAPRVVVPFRDVNCVLYFRKNWDGEPPTELDVPRQAGENPQEAIRV